MADFQPNDIVHQSDQLRVRLAFKSDRNQPFDTQAPRLPREQLYARIDERVHRMIRDGLVDEVRALRHLPHPISREAAQALGYKELYAHLDGRCTLPEAVEQIIAVLVDEHVPRPLETFLVHAGERIELRLWLSTARKPENADTASRSGDLDRKPVGFPGIGSENYDIGAGPAKELVAA